jgi:CRISPR-associated endonuclease Csn1
MAIWLGLDIGTNSVGSAWVDTETKTIVLGVSVFPAGVEESEKKRGDPKNKSRRMARSQRRSIARRAKRKRQLRKLLIEAKLLPADPELLRAIFSPTKKEEKEKPERWNPWCLRRGGLERELSPYEFGRVLVHLNQRRGAFGVEIDPDDPEEGKVKKAIECTDRQLAGRTFGQFMADLIDERRKPLPGREDSFYHEPVRNRRGAFEFHATRAMIRDEFNRLWEKQKSFECELAQLLTHELKRRLDDPEGNVDRRRTWRHQGVLFGQRRTYWDTGTMGRCELEPTDRCCPLADRHAQEFRVLETVNNLRIEERGKAPRPLNEEERKQTLCVLRCQKTATVATLRKALGIDKKDRKAFFTLNVERDPEREINTDWFYREIVHGALTDAIWLKMTEPQRESVNRAVLKFDAKVDEDAAKLRHGAMTWWGLSAERADKFIEACKTRPALDRRVKLSRRAIQNLLPYLRNPPWLSVTEARKRFAEDADSPATPEQRRRYSLKASALTKAERHFLGKHPNQLPPAPELSNPVVRKAIHEVRRHLNAYLQRFGRKPDRIVVEMVREARLPGKKTNEILARNRKREAIRKEIIKEFKLEGRTPNQRARVVERVILCRQQRGICPYSGQCISEKMAAEGDGLETDHIIPLSRSQDNRLSNKVLCFVSSNRDKGSQTPKEWLGDGSERFRLLETRMAHFERAEGVNENGENEFFTKKDYARKWENLHRDAPDREHFLNSQLTDTAYAARQVAQWLRDVLFDGEVDGTRRVFASKGIYTALLRRDWGLGEDALDQEWHSGDSAKVEQQGRARRDKKDRSDHRHHAVDALVIAFCGPERLGALADLAAEQEHSKAQQGRWTKGESLPPPKPWSSVEEFRGQARKVLDRLVVCHRPVKRRLVGWLHKANPYGPVFGSDKQFTKRIRIHGDQEYLKPQHLRLPIEETDQQVRQRLFERFKRKGLSEKEARQRSRKLFDDGQFKRHLIDPLPGKSGIVRDLAVRLELRKCLENNEVDGKKVNPENFSKAEIKALADAGKICMASGVPIRRVVLLRTIEDPVKIPGKQWDPAANRYVKDSDPRRCRVYDSQNNHHVEIREDTKGIWHGEVITMFDAAKRIRKDKEKYKRNGVDPSDREGQRFIMSLAEGETVHMRHPETGQPGYFVVFKIDKGAIHFVHQWDARPAKAKEGQQPREDVGDGITPTALKDLGPKPDVPPYKVHDDPLGNVCRINEGQHRILGDSPNR